MRIDRVGVGSGGNWFGWELIGWELIGVGIDSAGNWFGLEFIGWELWVYQKKTKNKQIFIDRLRNDRVRYDWVRNDRGLEMIGSQTKTVEPANYT